MQCSASIRVRNSARFVVPSITCELQLQIAPSNMGTASSKRDPADERKIAAIVEKLRADGAEADFRSAEDAERAVASAAAAETRRAARPARRTPARRAPATPPPTKRVKVKREGEPRRSVRQVATPKTYNERHLEAAAWAGRGTRDDPFVAA